MPPPRGDVSPRRLGTHGCPCSAASRQWDGTERQREPNWELVPTAQHIPHCPTPGGEGKAGQGRTGLPKASPEVTPGPGGFHKSRVTGLRHSHRLSSGVAPQQVSATASHPPGGQPRHTAELPAPLLHRATPTPPSTLQCVSAWQRERCRVRCGVRWARQCQGCSVHHGVYVMSAEHVLQHLCCSVLHCVIACASDACVAVRAVLQLVLQRVCGVQRVL